MTEAKDTDILVCDICTNHYNDSSRQPKFLSCHHSYCKSCLSQLSLRDRIECPSCRQATRLPPGGVAGLQTNFYISQLKEILKSRSHVRARGCKKHYSQHLSFYCQKCTKAICRDCTVLDHREKDGHVIQDIEVAETEQKERLAVQRRASANAAEDARRHLHQLENEREKLDACLAAAADDVDGLFGELAGLLEARRAELVRQLTDQCEAKRSQIEDGVGALTPKLRELHESLAGVDDALKRGSLENAIHVRTGLKRTTGELRALLHGLAHAADNVLFDASAGRAELEAAVSRVGLVYLDEAVPARSEVRMPELTASIQARATIAVYSAGGKPLPGDGVDVTLRDDQGDNVEKYLSWTGTDGSFVFIPQVPGNVYVSVLFRGQFIQGSSLVTKVSSNNPIATFGRLGSGQGTFNSPRAIAINRLGELYVADTGNRVIQKLDADGNFLHQFDISNGVDENSTCDLALSADESRLVCTETVVDRSNNPKLAQTVAVYTTDGRLTRRFDNAQMKCALCVASNRHDEIVLSDYSCRSLFVHDQAGRFLRKIGNDGTFSHPSFLCVTDDDCIVVSDTNTHTIQVFSREGSFLRQFGKAGKCKGELRQPFGVACDGEYILVVDSGNSRIQVFTKNGAFVSTIDSQHEPMAQPRGMAITRDGYLYVADRDNHCIKKYRYK